MMARYDKGDTEKCKRLAIGLVRYLAIDQDADDPAHIAECIIALSLALAAIVHGNIEPEGRDAFLVELSEALKAQMETMDDTIIGYNMLKDIKGDRP